MDGEREERCCCFLFRLLKRPHSTLLPLSTVNIGQRPWTDCTDFALYWLRNSMSKTIPSTCKPWSDKIVITVTEVLHLYRWDRFYLLGFNFNFFSSPLTPPPVFPSSQYAHEKKKYRVAQKEVRLFQWCFSSSSFFVIRPAQVFRFRFELESHVDIDDFFFEAAGLFCASHGRGSPHMGKRAFQMLFYPIGPQCLSHFQVRNSRIFATIQILPLQQGVSGKSQWFFGGKSWGFFLRDHKECCACWGVRGKEDSQKLI